jgi:hypothetical protein
MDFNGIRDFICAKVSKTDTYAQARCTDYIKARDKMIYEGFDWKAAQIIVDKPLNTGSGTRTEVSLPEVHHVLSVRLDGKLLDPVSASFVFENSDSVTDDYATAGTPKYYEEFFDLTAQTRKIRFFPPLADDGTNHSLTILGKAPYPSAPTSPTIPATENAIVAYATGDMWEYLHQVAKAQTKFQEGGDVLKSAQSNDSPSSQRPRASRRMTPAGNSLCELSDAVCDIVGDFTPATRDSAKDRIRRNYQLAWNMAAWPETIVMATTAAVNGVVVLPHLMDKVIGVRINLDVNNLIFQTLRYEDSSVFLGIQPDVFDQTGTPVSYNIMLPSALPNAISAGSKLKLVMQGSESANVFIRGELSGVEVFETIKATQAGVTTGYSYDDIHSLTKGVTKYSLQVQDVSSNVLMELRSTEQDRKYSRIRLYPVFDDTADQSVFILAKRKLPQLMSDGDTCLLTGIENFLINASAADLMLKSSPETSATLRSKADAGLKTLVDRETSQQTFAPRILPYTESSELWC